MCDTPLLDLHPGSDKPKPVQPYVVHDLKEYESGLLSSAENVHLITASCDETMAKIQCNEPVEVGAVAPADLIAPSPCSHHTYYTPSPTYGNFRFIRVQELTEIQH